MSKIYNKQYYRDKYAYRKNNEICVSCGKSPPIINSILCEVCLIRNRENNKKIQRKSRQEVLSHYGNKCKCCGEYRYEFLTIDHINNDGAKQRREWFGEEGNNKGAGHKTILKIKELNFPTDIQILCWNCNCAKQHYGICPHQKENNE